MTRFRFASAILVLLLAAMDETSAFTTTTTTTTRPPSQTKFQQSNQLLQPQQSQLQQRTPQSYSTTSLEMSTTAKALKIAAGAAVAGTAFVKGYLDRPARAYEEGSVAREYDAWADDGILEYYWGEHIHLGYYSKEDMKNGYKKKDFVQAKYDFIDEMMKFGGIDPQEDSEATVLDVGCGFGGTSRYLAKKLGLKSSVTGITLSPRQVQRGTELAEEQGTPNAKFTVMNALEMDFPDNSFDIVWACESGEHMPDKELYINEMMRVLKPGGKFVMATWCERDESKGAFDKRDKRDLQYLYEEWTHPHFISIEKYADLLEKTNKVENIVTADWCEQTIASWRHSIWVGIYDPKGFIYKPKRYLRCVRDAYCLERMHRAFKRGLMEYGMFTARKQKFPEKEVKATASEITDKVQHVKHDVQDSVGHNIDEAAKTKLHEIHDVKDAVKLNGKAVKNGVKKELDSKEKEVKETVKALGHDD